MQPVKMFVATIRIDGGTQARAAINEEAVAEYAETYKAGADMPPVDVFHDGAEYWLADGFHRYHGARRAGIESIAATIHNGTQREAILFAVGANIKHGLRRSSDDKSKAILILLNDPEWGTYSEIRIGQIVGVSQQYVSKVKTSLTTVVVSDVKYMDKHGNVGTMNTANIGKKKEKKPREKTAKQLAKEAAKAEADRIAKEANEGIDLADSLAETLRDNEALAVQLKALQTDDTKAELKKQLDIRKAVEARLNQELSKVHALDRELRHFCKWFEELRNITGTKSNRDAMAAIRVAFKVTA